MVKYLLGGGMAMLPEVLLALAYLWGPTSLWLWPLALVLERYLWRGLCRCVDNEEKARRRGPDGLLEKNNYAEMIIAETSPSCQEGTSRREAMLREVSSYDRAS